MAAGDNIPGVAAASSNDGTQDGAEFSPLANPYRDPETGRFTFAPDDEDMGEETGENDNEPPPLL